MFPPIRTGTSFYSLNLASALRARGHEVAVVTLRNREAGQEDLPYRVHRLPGLHLPVKNYFKHFRVCSLHPVNYLRMSGVLREFGAQAVLLVNHYLDIAYPALFAAWRNRVPVVCSVGTQLQSPDPLRHRILNVLDRLICGGTIFPFCERIVAWDDQIVTYLRDVQGEALMPKVRVVNYGVNGDPALFTAHSHDYRMHNQLLGVGAVIEQRDFTALVRVFRLVCDEFPELRLKIIGHVYKDQAVKLAAELGISERVTFTGERPHPEVLKELKKSDAYFASLTGRYIGLGTATLEAMLTGVPTIVNAYPSILGCAPLEDMKHLVLSNGLSVEAVAERLRLLLADEALRRSIGQSGRRFVLEHMNWEKVAADMEALLEEVVSGRRAGAAAATP